ncbi:MAG: hypothetical protein HUJ30_00950 [Gammaproteobacteria bacterium]|nr:hypothetical protein [Gammaproteobacteria bacterium]
MDENHYRSTYQTINETRCWFEKAINSRHCQCARMERFNLADREGVRCTSKESQIRCHRLLELIREKAIFALQLTKVDGPLPHGKEVKVQLGGMLALQKRLSPELADADRVTDIHQTIDNAISQFGSLEQLPYVEMMQTIVNIQGRSRRKDRSK